MPELPEVEVARRGLAKWLARAMITRVFVADARVVRPSARALTVLAGARVVSVDRRGKWLRVDLEDGGKASSLFAHLGMSGEWVRVADGAPAERFERVRFDVRVGKRASSVRYLDMRMFGRVIVAPGEIASWT